MKETSETEAYVRTKYLKDLENRLGDNIMATKKSEERKVFAVSKKGLRILLYLSIGGIILIGGFQLAGKFFDFISRP